MFADHTVMDTTMCTPHSSMQYIKEMGKNELNKYFRLQNYIVQDILYVLCLDICVLSFSDKQDHLVSDLLMVTCTYGFVFVLSYTSSVNNGNRA